MFTGVSKEDVIHKAIENGVDSFIQKIGDPKAQYSELSEKIWQAVSSSAGC